MPVYNENLLLPLRMWVQIGSKNTVAHLYNKNVSTLF